MPHFLIRDTNKYGRVPERPKGTDCKSVVTDFSGSNPLSPTKQTPNHMIGSLHLQGLVHQIFAYKSNIILISLGSVFTCKIKKAKPNMLHKITYGLTIERI